MAVYATGDIHGNPVRLSKDSFYEQKDFSGNKDENIVIILDPFSGSGTTCFVSKQMGKNYIGFELSKEYCDIAEKRLEGVPDDNK